MTDDWMLVKVSDYWDEQVRAIDTAARRLGSRSESDRTADLEAIAAAVTEHVRVLPDKTLAIAALTFIEDLYKAACRIDRWDDSLQVYLAASAGTMSRLLSERGLRIQYLVDNVWDDMQRPSELLPNWYGAAGVVFVCPQVLALDLIKADNVGNQTDLSGLIPRYIKEARDVAESIVVRCSEEGRYKGILPRPEERFQSHSGHF